MRSSRHPSFVLLVLAAAVLFGAATGFAQTRCTSDSSGFAGPCRREPHCESYVSSEAFFDLATRDLPAAGMDQDSAWQLVDRLWYQTRPGSGGFAGVATSRSKTKPSMGIFMG